MKTKNLLTLLAILLGVNLTAKAQVTLEGDLAVAGTEYFVVNVENGQYLKFGGANNAKAAEGHAGTLITLERFGNNYAIKTNAGYLDNNLMMTGARAEWVLTRVEGENQYYMKTINGRGVLSTKNDANGILALASYNPDDNKQKWILLTKSSLSQAFYVTPLIQAASFDKNDAIGAWGINANNITATNENTDAAEYHLTVTGARTITQNLGNCESGTYVLSFDAYYKRTSTNGRATAPEVSAQVHKKTTSRITINEGETWSEYNLTLNNNGGKGMIINIETYNNTELHIDNLILRRIDGHNKGQEEVEEENKDQFKEWLNAYITQKQAEVDLLNEAGRAAYDISGVIADLEAGNINSEETFQAAIVAIDAAYEVALEAHNQKELEDLLGGGDTPGDTEEEKEVDVTDLFIKNAGFGTGDDSYWTINGAVISTSGIGVTGATGSYLFRGVSIRQDVTLTNGKYKLTANVASTNGATITLTANAGKLTEQSTSLTTDNTMKEITLNKVIVYDGELFIQVTGSAAFYVDDFRLSYQEALPDDPQLKDTENLNAEVDFYPTITISRTIKPDTWSTFVVPFNMEIPEGWEVKGLTSSTMEDDCIQLTFDDVTSIEAGVPYMVRVTETVSTITGTNVWLNTELKPTQTEYAGLVGTYTNGYVPIGCYFISSNKFYRCVNESNPDKLKSYRAYISTTAHARSIGYRFENRDEEQSQYTTSIDEQATQEPTIVAIYTLDGRRVEELQQGINIVQMSNGTVVKVFIK